MRRLPVLLALLLGAVVAPAHAAPGALDTSFDHDGIVTAFPPGAVATSVAIDARHRITAAGYTIDARPDVLVARFLPDGSLDPSFGIDGRARFDLGGADYAFDMVVTHGGGVVVAGQRTKAQDRVFVLRLRSDGTRMPAFGRDGLTLIDFDARFQSANAVALTPQGRIVIGGYTSDGILARSMLARLSPDGALDPGFSGHGAARFDLAGGVEQIQDVVVLSGGSVVAAGFAENPQGPKFTVLKLGGDGRLDTAFGRSPGYTTVDVGPGPDIANALTPAPGGGYLLAGSSNGQWAVVAVDANGGLVPSYGTHGRVVLHLGPRFEEATDVDTVGARTLLVGRIRGTGDDIGVVRLKPDGTRNKAYGTDGVVRIDVNGGRDAAAAGVVQGNGRLIVAGQTWRAGDPHFLLARLLNG